MESQKILLPRQGQLLFHSTPMFSVPVSPSSSLSGCQVCRCVSLGGFQRPWVGLKKMLRVRVCPLAELSQSRLCESWCSGRRVYAVHKPRGKEGRDRSWNSVQRPAGLISQSCLPIIQPIRNQSGQQIHLTDFSFTASPWGDQEPLLSPGCVWITGRHQFPRRKTKNRLGGDH